MSTAIRKKVATMFLTESSFFKAETRHVAASDGEISFKLYIPATKARHPALVVMLHGCNQTPDDFALGTGMNGLADIHGFLVAYPAQTKSQNRQYCWNWYEPQNQGRSGEPARIVAIVDDLIAQEGVDPSRVYVAGMSAGGAMAAILGRAYPEKFAAIAIHSGVPTGAATNLPFALAAMRYGGRGDEGPGPTPSIIFHGEDDPQVSPKNGDRLALSHRQLRWPRLRQRTWRAGGRRYRRIIVAGRAGVAPAEYWKVEGLGHAWSGGNDAGSYADAPGPNASRAMIRFFLGRHWPARLHLLLQRLWRGWR